MTLTFRCEICDAESCLAEVISHRVLWAWMLLPQGAVLGGLSVLIPLQILSPMVKGTAVEVGLVAGAATFSMIPGAMIWGYIADLYQKRKVILVLANIGTTIGTFALYFANDVSVIAGLFSMIRFLSSANSVITPLLLIESVPRAVWVRQYPNMMLISQVGMVLGVIPGAIWTGPIRDYFVVLSVVSAGTVALAQLYVKEPAITMERKAVALTYESLTHKLHDFHLIFLHLPRPSHFLSLWKLVKSGLMHQVPLLFVSSFLYFLGSSTFVTAYIPFLKDSGASDVEVFSVNSVMLTVGAIAIPFASRRAAKTSEHKTSVLALLGRTSVAFGGFILASAGSGVPRWSFLILPSWSVTYAFYHSSSSVMLFKSLHSGKQGEYLGVYSAFNGTAMFLGAIASGYISLGVGYWLTFSSSALILALGLYVLSHFPKATH